MTNYVVKMIGGTKLTVNENEYKAILQQGSGILTLAPSGLTVNIDRIETVYPELQADIVENRREQMTGILHDGTRVRRHFGEWVDATSQVPDDRSNYQAVKIDPAYYPEVAADCVPTEQEYHRHYEQLPVGERLEAITGSVPERRRSIKGGMESFGEIAKHHK